MECKTALRLMDVCRPSGDDLSDPELVPLTVHLEECSECLGRFRTRQAFDAQVAKAMRAVAVPSGLRERIFEQVDRSVIRARRHRVIRYAMAAAAAVLVAVTASFWAYWPPTRHQDVIAAGELAGLAEFVLVDAIDVPASISTPVRIENWCVKQMSTLRLGAVPPRAFQENASQANALVGIARANFCDRWVAVFRYRSATVLAWPRQSLEVEGLGSSPRRIHWTRDLTVMAWVEGDTVYVAVFKGGVPKDWEHPDRPGLT